MSTTQSRFVLITKIIPKQLQNYFYHKMKLFFNLRNVSFRLILYICTYQLVDFVAVEALICRNKF